MKKKSQGEIFGVALMFVIIIIGIIVYSKFSSIDGSRDEDMMKGGRYTILSESTLNGILKVSTTCQISRDRDSLKDLINYCLENEYGGVDPTITCGGDQVYACKHAIKILNETLHKMYDDNYYDKDEGIYRNATVINVPFLLEIDVLSNNVNSFSNLTITNFGNFEYKGKNVTRTNYRKLGYSKAPSGLIQWSTAQRNIQFELSIYYR